MIRPWLQKLILEPQESPVERARRRRLKAAGWLAVLLFLWWMQQL